MKKVINIIKNNPMSVILSICALIFLLIVLFFYDIGINTKSHVKKDFNSAFTARQNGDCDSFKDYALNEKDYWYKKCEDERLLKTEPIRDFHIAGISINKNNAYLSVELIRDRYSLALDMSSKGHKLPEGGYLVNYKLTRDTGGWFINNDIKKESEDTKIPNKEIYLDLNKPRLSLYGSYEEGFEWAERNNIKLIQDCEFHDGSFSEGCIGFVEENY